jgi:hypothetical protein
VVVVGRVVVVVGRVVVVDVVVVVDAVVVEVVVVVPEPMGVALSGVPASGTQVATKVVPLDCSTRRIDVGGAHVMVWPAVPATTLPLIVNVPRSTADCATEPV